MIIDRWYIIFWILLSPLFVLATMGFIQNGLTCETFILSILFGAPQFIILSVVPLAEYYDNKRKVLTTD